MNAYFGSFRRESFAEPETLATLDALIEQDPMQGDLYLRRARRHILKENYTSAFADVQKAMALNCTKKAECLNLRATFLYLKGDLEEALADLNASLQLNPMSANSLLKRGSVQMELGVRDEALQDFELAEKYGPKDPDVFYHRAQLLMLLNEFQRAVDDYRHSLDLDSSNQFAHIQYCVALYKVSRQSEAFDTFERALKLFPKSCYVCNYLGELLVDQQRFEEASTRFDQAIKLTPENPLPYINKALILVYQRQDVDGAIALCRRAISADPKCDIAYAHLAQLLLQQGQIQESIENYDKAIELTRSEAEMANIYSCREAAAAQLYVLTKLLPPNADI